MGDPDAVRKLIDVENPDDVPGMANVSPNDDVAFLNDQSFRHVSSPVFTSLQAVH
jgi:hypothetical protein